MSDSDDVVALFRRFARIEDIVGLGAAELSAGHGQELAEALADTCAEAARVAEAALRKAAEDDFWPLVQPAAAMWTRLGALVDLGLEAGARVPVERAGLDTVAGYLNRIAAAAEAAENALAELAAYPDDKAGNAAVIVAIADLAEAGDRLLVSALDASGTTRLDAAVAVLTTVAAAAARAERERGRLHGDG